MSGHPCSRPKDGYVTDSALESRLRGVVPPSEIYPLEAETPLAGEAETGLRGWALLAKSLVDRLGALALLILLSPFLVAIALAVRLTSPGPVLYNQVRVGQAGSAVHTAKVPHHERRRSRPADISRMYERGRRTAVQDAA